MGRTLKRFFNIPEKVEVVKEYRVDQYTRVQKLSNGVELVEEDYTEELESQPDLCLPKRVQRALHPGGRQDCNIQMSRLSMRSKSKTKGE